MSTPLVKEFTYNVPATKVWEAITDTAKMKEWYFPQLQKFEPTVGYQFQFEDSGAQYQKEWIVTKITKDRALAHSWAYKGYRGISEVQFDLCPEEDATRLKVTQTGLESFPDHAHFKLEMFERGWECLLGSNLKNLLEQSV